MLKDTLGFLLRREFGGDVYGVSSGSLLIKEGSMKSTCRRCGGFVVDEQVLDYYQASRWRCVNCGWYRRETEISSRRAVRLANRGAYR